MKKLFLYIFLSLIFCNVSFAKDLTGTILSCSYYNPDTYPDNPRTWEHTYYNFLTDKNVRILSMKSFNLRDEANSTYSVSLTKITVKKNSSMHYAIDSVIERSTLRAGMMNCGIIQDENFDIGKAIKEKLQEAIDAQEKKNKI